MSKFITVPNGNYHIKVQEGGKIVLDATGSPGFVEIRGDLTVLGTTTTVQSTEMTISDNIILLNQGETGDGITMNGSTSGLQIDRGTRPDAFFVYDEDLTDPLGSSPGLFAFKLDGGSAKGIRTNYVSTGGGDLLLVGSGTGVVTVTGTVDYELHVTDDDDITNKKYVDDAISTAFATVFLSQIGDGTLTTSSITIVDEETSGVDSVINFSIDANTVSQLYADRWEFTDLRFIGTKIETITSDEDLILASPGTGSIRIEDVLHVNSVPTADDPSLSPAFPLDGVKIYAADQSTGKTGLYIANANENRDELVSKNRSLLFSMLF